MTMRRIGCGNMGQGMLLITPQPEAVMTIARQHGIPAQVIGEVTSSPHTAAQSRLF